MSKKEIQKNPSGKADLLLDKILSNLDQIQEGKVKGITKTLALVSLFVELHKLNGLLTSDFFGHALIKKNNFNSIDWKVDKVNNNERFRAFLNYSLINSLNKTVDEIKETEPYKYETLREIAPSVISAITNASSVLKAFCNFSEEALVPWLESE